MHIFILLYFIGWQIKKNRIKKGGSRVPGLDFNFAHILLDIIIMAS